MSLFPELCSGSLHTNCNTLGAVKIDVKKERKEERRTRTYEICGNVQEIQLVVPIILHEVKPGKHEIDQNVSEMSRM
jgi:hypothetical protein